MRPVAAKVAHYEKIWWRAWPVGYEGDLVAHVSDPDDFTGATWPEVVAQATALSQRGISRALDRKLRRYVRRLAREQAQEVQTEIVGPDGRPLQSWDAK